MIFLTGGTGYLGSYVIANLVREHSDRLAVLVRADSVADAHVRLWRSLQLHMDFEAFEAALERIDVVLGDLTSPRLGLTPETWQGLARRIESVLHCAASLNRKSDKACFNVNLRGTLEVVKLARAAQDHHGLRRFSDVSTTAIAGHRQGETVTEAAALDWQRSDYDPYARTKKFCEHMVHELLPDVPVTVFRPSIVLGDSQRPETTQFDMVRAFVILAQLPVLPLKPDLRVDIVPADYVGRAIVHVHQDPEPRYDTYHLSSGTASLTYGEIVSALRSAGVQVPRFFMPRLEPAVRGFVEAMSQAPRAWPTTYPASLFKVFLPYLTFDTVFDNTRVVEALGEAPVGFSEYAPDLLRFAIRGKFTYPYRPWPDGRITANAQPGSRGSLANDPSPPSTDSTSPRGAFDAFRPT